MVDKEITKKVKAQVDRAAARGNPLAKKIKKQMEKEAKKNDSDTN